MKQEKPAYARNRKIGESGKKECGGLKKIWSWMMTVTFVLTMLCRSSTAAQEDSQNPGDLYARSAVLMDGSSGRILYGKNENEILPMASTTKIMTCIVTLENADPEETVQVSANAAQQPEVHLGMLEGEKYRLKDLLYSLMLESHNDSAVAIAEHVGGSVEAFAEMMNEKAEALGCTSTHYVTPNGLDDSDAGGAHSTTAADLARVMSYCITQSPQRELFLEITQTRSCSFSNMEGTRSFSCSNHNAFLDMMEGAISGKTGFTSAAGYCYVGAAENKDRVFVVALLACGWPYNKTYKWSDTLALMKYGIENFENRTIQYGKAEQKLTVEDGIAASGNPWEEASVMVQADFSGAEKKNYLLGKAEKIVAKATLPGKLQAPLVRGDAVGKIGFYLGETLLEEYPVRVTEAVEERRMRHCTEWVFDRYFLF